VSSTLPACRLNQQGIWWDIPLRPGARFLGLLVHIEETKSARTLLHRRTPAQPLRVLGISATTVMCRLQKPTDAC
jgi:hypothetical protein